MSAGDGRASSEGFGHMLATMPHAFAFAWQLGIWKCFSAKVHACFVTISSIALSPASLQSIFSMSAGDGRAYSEGFGHMLATMPHAFSAFAWQLGIWKCFSAKVHACFVTISSIALFPATLQSIFSM